MLKRKLAALVLALSAIAGVTAGAVAYNDAHQPVSVQAGECEWGYHC